MLPPLDTMTPEVARIAASLKAEGAQEVYLFGSTARGESHRDSDIDLAVVGLPPSVFYRAISRAGRAAERPLDVVDLDADSPFTRHLRSSGELLRVA